MTFAGPALAGALVAAPIAGRWETGALALGAALVAARAVGARPPGRAWRASMAGGAALALVLNLYLTPGRPLAAPPAVLGHAATAEGLRAGILVVLRMAGALAAVRGLAAWLPGERGADALARWCAPLARLGVPVGEMRAVLGLGMRALPLLRDEAERVGRVQRLRAGQAPRGMAARARALRAATVPALVGALERADRTALALEVRHYRARPPAPAIDRPRLGTPAGWCVAAALVVVCGLWR
jgi:energy-coupling factor transporter transmembrane protein EcfT